MLAYVSINCSTYFLCSQQNVKKWGVAENTPLTFHHPSLSFISVLFMSLQLSPSIMNTLLKGTFNVTLNNPLSPCCSPRVADGPLTAHKAIKASTPNTFIATSSS